MNSNQTKDSEIKRTPRSTAKRKFSHLHVIKKEQCP